MAGRGGVDLLAVSNRKAKGSGRKRGDGRYDLSCIFQADLSQNEIRKEMEKKRLNDRRWMGLEERAERLPSPNVSIKTLLPFVGNGRSEKKPSWGTTRSWVGG